MKRNANLPFRNNCSQMYCYFPKHHTMNLLILVHFKNLQTDLQAVLPAWHASGESNFHLVFFIQASRCDVWSALSPSLPTQDKRGTARQIDATCLETWPPRYKSLALDSAGSFRFGNEALMVLSIPVFHTGITLLGHFHTHLTVDVAMAFCHIGCLNNQNVDLFYIAPTEQIFQNLRQEYSRIQRRRQLEGAFNQAEACSSSDAPSPSSALHAPSSPPGRQICNWPHKRIDWCF